MTDDSTAEKAKSAIPLHTVTYRNGAAYACFCEAGDDHGPLDSEVRALREQLAEAQATIDKLAHVRANASKWEPGKFMEAFDRILSAPSSTGDN